MAEVNNVRKKGIEIKFLATVVLYVKVGRKDLLAD